MHHPEIMRDYDREELFTKLQAMMEEAMRLKDLYLGLKDFPGLPMKTRRLRRLS